jgi:hypothetical protein
VPAYTLTLNLLQDSVKIAEYSGPLAALAPENWTYFSRRPYNFTLNEYYWVKFYLNGGNLKPEVWQGAKQNEPAAWLAEGTDPTPCQRRMGNVCKVWSGGRGGRFIQGR